MRPLPLLRAALAIAVVSVVGACDRRTEAYVPPEAEPPPSGRPVQIPNLAQTRMDQQAIARTLGEGSPQAEESSGSGGPGGPAAGPGESQEGKDIQGTIRLGEGARAPDQGVLFVILRVPGLRPPLAAVKLPVGPFPQSFSIGPANRAPMLGSNVPFAGPMELTVRVDIDGNPMTHGPGELAGSGGTVQPGAKGVEIVLGESSD